MNIIDFYIDKYENIKSLENADLSFIPPLLKRKLSNLNKSAFYTLNKCFSKDTQCLFYASQFGELDKLMKLIEQYQTEGEVSPTLFSSSVHNSAVGAFALLKKTSIPYFALSANVNTISMGILTALISQYDNIVFCFADKDNSLAFSIKKKKTEGMHCKLTLCDSLPQCNVDEYNLLTDFLEQKTDKLHFVNYKIERNIYD